MQRASAAAEARVVGPPPSMPLPISRWFCSTLDQLPRSTLHEVLVAMAYSRAFFEFQLTFASRLAAKFDLSLADTLYHYTTFTKSFDSGAWIDFLAGVHQAPDATTWIYEWYRAHQQPDPKPHDSHYDGHPLFGCFYFVLRDAHIIRPHFI